jgi:hypothetical protein
MMNKLLITTVLFFSVKAYAQDVITERNGHSIRGKVLSVTPTEVSYKSDPDPNAATITIPKGEVLSISYSDGSSMNFSDPADKGLSTVSVQHVKGDSIKVDAVNTYKRGDRILYKNDNGKFRTGIIVGLKPNFAIVRARGGTREMPYSQIAKYEEN